MKLDGLGLVLALGLLATQGCSSAPPTTYEKSVLVEGSDFHGIHGITVGPDGQLYAGSVVGAATYKIDPQSGAVEEYLPPLDGMCDDLEFGPDDQLVWTAFLIGNVHSLKPGGDIEILATGLPGINSIAWKQDGRLFATQVFLGDALYEIDPTGEKEPRLILEGMGGLNGFDFGPDGRLYGPLWFKGEVVRVNVDSGALETVATGFEIPAAANFDSQGNLWVVDTARGEVVRVDPSSGEKTVVARHHTAIDNLALSPDDRLFITNMADNGIYEIDTTTGEARTVVEGRLAAPADLAIFGDGEGETLYLADIFAYRTIDPASGEVTAVLRMYGDELENPMSISVGEDSVLLTTWYADVVQRVDRRSGESLGMMHGFEAPGALLQLDGDRFLVSQIADGALIEVSGNGEERRTVVEGLVLPVGLAPAGPGKVYVSEAGAGSLSEIDLASGEKRLITSELGQPEGIDVLPDGRIAAADVARRELVLVDPQSGDRLTIASDLPVGLPMAPSMPASGAPTGVAVSQSGTIYMTADLENAIYRFTPQAN